MVNERDILALRLHLERAKAQLLSRRLGEPAAWRLLRRTHDLLNRSRGTSFFPTLQVIYSLVETLWSNTRQQALLRELKSDLT